MSQGLKDRDLQEYYEALFGMYTTPGWQKLMEDVAYQLKLRDTPRDIVTAEQLHERRGELAQLDWLVTHQMRTEHAYAHLLEEEGQDAADVQSHGVAKVVDANVREE
jgi:hypothetical protein